MKFGYGYLTAQTPPDVDRSQEQTYQEMLQLAQVAEESGFDSVWLTEHHFMSDGYSPSVFPMGAAVAQATDSIEIGTAIALAPLYDPLRLAEDVATVDLLSGGRFNLGIANGYMKREFEAFGVPLSERAIRTREVIEICRRAWKPGPFSFDGKIFDYEDIDLNPKPAQSSGPPILLGGTSEPAVNRAARVADGHIGVMDTGWQPEDASEEEAKDKLDFFGDQSQYLVAEQGVDPDTYTFAVTQYGYVAEEYETAWEEMLPSFLYHRKNYAAHSKNRDPSEFDPETISEERLERLQENVFCGDPSTLIDRLRTLEDNCAGELTVIMGMWQSKLPFERNASAIETFGSEVIPAFE